MKQLINKLKGDKGYGHLALLALFSFMPVLVPVVIWLIWAMEQKYIRLFSKTFCTYLYRFCNYLFTECPSLFQSYFKMAFTRCLILLLYNVNQRDLLQGKCQVDSGAFIGISFQTSTLASVVLFIFVVCYLSKLERNTNYFKASLWELLPFVFFTLILILPANFSTTALIFAMILMLVFKVSIKYMELL
jgi:cell division protein FtsW